MSEDDAKREHRPRPLRGLLWREMRLEWRTRETVLATGLFAVIVALILSFTVAEHVVASLPGLAAEQPQTARLQAGEVAGLIWVAFTFATTLGLGRAFAREREAGGGGMDALLLIPADWCLIFLAKLLATLAFTLFAHTATLLVFVVLLALEVTVATLAWILLVALVATLGHVALGLVVAALTSSLRAREVLLPVLLLPLLIPLFLAATEATALALTGFLLPGAWHGFLQSLLFLLMLDVLYLGLGFLLFPVVLRE